MRLSLPLILVTGLAVSAASETGPSPAGVLIAPAAAQAAPSPVGFLTRMPEGATRVSGLRGTDVIGSDIQRLGTIDDVVLDANGAVAAVVIGVGGFLGIGEKKVAVPYGALLWNYDVSPTTGPSSSNTGTPAPAGRPELQTRSAVGTEPGPENTQATGTVGDPSKPAEGLRPQGATVPITGGGAPRSAVLRMTTEELRNAPEFGGR